jgi:hypothetical protein
MIRRVQRAREVEEWCGRSTTIFPETCRLPRKNASSREREVTSLRFETESGGLIELSGKVWE